jgi:transposase
LSSTYRLLHRMQLSWLAPRPRHPEADATAQAEFSQL